MGDFSTMYNHVILDHRQCPLLIFPNDDDGRVIYKCSKNKHLSTVEYSLVGYIRHNLREKDV